jgi:glutaminyl-peptide cyclotransferase
MTWMIFPFVGQFTYPTEGWGLTHDGEWLIMSDGSHRLYFLDPQDFADRQPGRSHLSGSRLSNG